MTDDARFMMDIDGDQEAFKQASEVANALHNAIMDDFMNGKWGEFYMPDGSPMMFELVVRARNPVPSPEETGVYPPCACGEEEKFKGIDERCGARQRFTVTDGGEPDHDTYDPFDIGSYSEIRCGSCDALIWEEYL